MHSVKAWVGALVVALSVSTVWNASASESPGGEGRAESVNIDSVIAAENASTRAGVPVEGIVINEKGNAEVQVLTESSARAIRAAGGAARMVEYGQKALGALSKTLETELQSVGSVYAISIDPLRDRVIVRSSADSVADVRSLVNDSRVEVVAGDVSQIKPAKTLYAGLSMDGCTAGYNGVAWSRTVMLTVGHCLPALGSVVTSSYTGARTRYGVALSNLWKDEGYDAGLVDYDSDVSTPPYVLDRLSSTTVITVSGYANVYGGLPVCKHGAKTGYTCGYVTDIGARVKLSGSWLRGLVGTTMCAWGGDSGGPVLAGRAAAALVSHYDTSMSCPWNSGWSSDVPASDSRRSWHTDMGVFRGAYYNASLKVG